MYEAPEAVNLDQDECPKCGGTAERQTASCAACNDCGSWFEVDSIDPVQFLMCSVEQELRKIDGSIAGSASSRPDMTPDDDVDYFGGCPECHGSDSTLSPAGNHWGVCRRHFTKWSIGWNLFSGWRGQSEWDSFILSLYLSAYRKVEPYIAPQERVAGHQAHKERDPADPFYDGEDRPEALQHRIDELAKEVDRLRRRRQRAEKERHRLIRQQHLERIRGRIGKPVWREGHSESIGILRETWHDMALVERSDGSSGTIPVAVLHESEEQALVPF